MHWTVDTCGSKSWDPYGLTHVWCQLTDLVALKSSLTFLVGITVPRASEELAFASSAKFLSILVSATFTINVAGISVHQSFKSHVHQSSGSMRACAGERPEYIQFRCQKHLVRVKRA